MEKHTKIAVYTDGACRGNPGPGGWGFVLRAYINGELIEKELAAGYRKTTNNRMELMAVIYGLFEASKLGDNLDIEVVSDSTYVCDAFNMGWLNGWKHRNWKNASGKTVPNKDLWLLLIDMVNKHNSVKFIWIKGHAGHEFNERCDKLAVEAALDSKTWFIDEGYENKYN